MMISMDEVDQQARAIPQQQSKPMAVGEFLTKTIMLKMGYICLLFFQLVLVTQSNVIKDQEKIWQTWQIPYTVQAGMSKSVLNQITIALNRISRRTCLTFPARKNEPDYIHFLESSGCSSDIGRQGGMQTITIGSTCSSPTNIVHEVMHALGFMHEHQRPDRDEFVEIVWKNIQSGRRHNFNKLSYEKYNATGLYDYNSIMHYRSTMFGNGRTTIRAKKPVAFIGYIDDLSALDVWKINKVYHCNQTQCTHPALPEGGILMADNIDVGRAKVEYSCKNNHQDIRTSLIGSHYRYCTKSAEWSGRSPACLESVSHYCDFDEQICGWTQLTRDSADWLWQQGKSDSWPASGPPQDHSLGFDNHGRYMLLSSHRVRGRKKAILKSPALSLQVPSNDTLCLRYYYYMSGFRMGNLVVKTVNYILPGTEAVAAWHYGNQGDNWLEENVKVSPDTKFVIFEGVTSRRGSSDIAIDDVMIAPCSALMRSAHQSFYASGMGKIVHSDVDGDDSTGNITGEAATAFSCDFNADDCSITSQQWSVVSPQAGDDTLPCHRVHCGKKRGCMDELPQALQKINPDKEETIVGVASGDICSKLCEENPICAAATYAIDLEKCYKHFESVADQVVLDADCMNHYIKPMGCDKVGRYAVSRGNGQMETVEIKTSRSHVHCICFYFYMDATTSSLSLDIQQTSGGKTSAYYQAGLFKLERKELHKWKHANFEVDLNSTYRLRFTSRVAGGGVVAVDDIMVYDGSCSFIRPFSPESRAVIQGFDCDFNSDMCGWSIPQGATRKWTRNRGSTGTRKTGPRSDRSGNGYYLYAESSFIPRNTQYDLLSPEVRRSNRGWCLTVFYNMYGRNMGSLDILYRQMDTDTARRLVKVSGNQGKQWKVKKLTIDSDSAFQVIIRAVIGNGSKSDIAIDDVSIIRGRCSDTCAGKT